MTSFTELMARLAPQGDDLSIEIPEDWMQGRTTYGGLTAALCLQAVRRAFPTLPALRSAQISFIGPAGGAVRLSPVLLRQGKSMTFAGADLVSEQGVATRAVFAFGAARESALNRTFMAPPEMRPRNECEPYIPEGFGPPFARHYESLLVKGARPLAGSSEYDHWIWARHRDKQATDDVALLALADLPPAAVVPMFKTFGPISSVTWGLNFLEAAPTTEAGWWLMQSRAENAREGYSSQDMIVWNSAGEPVITGRQTVAIFV